MALAIQNRSTKQRGAGRLVTGAAWFFIVFTLAQLAWVIGSKWGSPAGLTTLYSTEVGDHVFRAWGLSYEGTGGLLQAIGQVVMVLAAAALSVVPWLRARRAGHVILVIWAAWWAMSLAGLALRDQHLGTLMQTGLLTTLLGCTTYRAWKGWSIRDGDQPAPSATDGNLEKEARTLVVVPDFAQRVSLAVGTSKRIAGRTAQQLRRGASKVSDHEMTRCAARRSRQAAGRAMSWLRGHGVVPEKKQVVQGPAIDHQPSETALGTRSEAA